VRNSTAAHARRAKQLAAADAFHPPDQIVKRGITRDVAGKPSLGAGHDFPGDLIDSEADDRDGGVMAAQDAHDLEALPCGHVDDHDMRPRMRHHGQRLLGGGRRAHDLEPRALGQAGLHPLAVQPHIRDD
jgi:hypothetical protein